MKCDSCGDEYKPSDKRPSILDGIMNLCPTCDSYPRKRQLLNPGPNYYRKIYYHQCEFQNWHTGMPVPGFEIPKNVTQARGSVLGIQFKNDKVMMMFQIDVIMSEGGEFERWM